MSKICKNCGCELPDDASFCHNCATSIIDKEEAKKPVLWRKKAVIVGLVLIVLALIFLPHRPKIHEGLASLTYDDYYIITTTKAWELDEQKGEELRTLSLTQGEGSGVIVELGVYKDGKYADVDTFMSKVKSYTLDVSPDENNVFTINKPVNNKENSPAMLEAGIYFPSDCGTNDIIWTLNMKNGDTVRVRQTLKVTELPREVYSTDNAKLDTVEDINELLKQIDEEVPMETTVDIYLPAVNYTGDIVLENRAVNLYGYYDGESKTSLNGSIIVNSSEPDVVRIDSIDFIGDGGEGLVANASTNIWNCSFTGYDVGASVKDNGMIVMSNTNFINNKIGYKFDTTSYRYFSNVIPDCVFDGNKVGIQIMNLPLGDTVYFDGTTFKNNDVDIDNLIKYPVDTSESIFE